MSFAIKPGRSLLKNEITSKKKIDNDVHVDERRDKDWQVTIMEK